MTKEELRMELEKLGVETTTKMNKAQLQEMYEEVMVAEATPDGEACEAFGAFSKDSGDCADCPSAKACSDATVRKEEDAKVKKVKKETGPRTGKAVSVKSKYKDINELIEDISGVEVGSMCLAFDKLLVVGAGMNEFTEASNEMAEKLNIQPRNEKSILGHFKGRAKQGWVIDVDAQGIYSVVDVNNEQRVPRSDTKAYKEWKAQKDAETPVEETPVDDAEAQADVDDHAEESAQAEALMAVNA